MAMSTKRNATVLVGKTIARVAYPKDEFAMAIHFTDGTALFLSGSDEGVIADMGDNRYIWGSDETA